MDLEQVDTVETMLKLYWILSISRHMIGQIAYTPKTRLALTSSIKTRDISPNNGQPQ